MITRLALLFVLLPQMLLAQIRTVEASAQSSALDWSFMVKELQADSIICLGEESHWVETYLKVKTGVIKTLHQQLGIEVLIVESGFVNAFMANRLQLEGEKRLREAFYDIWHTQSVADLILYIDQQKKVQMVQFGCDIKGPVSYSFADFIQEVFTSIDPEYGASIRQLDRQFVDLRNSWEPEIGKAHRTVYLSEEEHQYYQAAYLALLEKLNQHQTQIKESQSWSDLEMEYLKRCVLNRQYLLQLMQLPTYQQKHQFRDAKMAENLEWLIQTYRPNTKYIIWGADIHLSKDAKWEQLGEGWLENKSMIEVLTEKLGDKKITSIGIKPVKSLPKGLKKELNPSADYFYVDLKSASNPEWAALRKEHDAIIFCRKIKDIKKYRLKLSD